MSSPQVLAECRLCSWRRFSVSVEHAEHLLAQHIGAAHSQVQLAEPNLMNQCLAAMAAFPAEVQRDAARHVLEGE